QCPQPTIISSRFNIEATKVHLDFTVAVETQEIPPTCDALFEDSYKLGGTAICEFTSPTQLTITLANKLIAGDTLTVKANILKNAECYAFVEPQTITILPPVGASRPVAV